jgi:microcystin-dependent protein
MADPFIGEIRLFGFPRVPDGWLACSGQSVSIGQYEALYTLIGTTYGGDGVQTFQLPDLRGRVPIGQGGTFVVGQNAGEEQHSLTNMEIPAHSHGLMSSTTTATAVTPGSSLHLATASSTNLYAPAAGAAPYAVMAPSLATAGSSLPHDNMMPTVVCNYCICFAGVFPSPG